MRLKRRLFGLVNGALRTAGFQLQPIARDFDRLPTDALTRDLMFSDLAQTFDAWVATQQVFTPAPGAAEGTRAFVERFFEAWLGSPYRLPGGGTRFNNMLALALMARARGPSLIIDSGTFRGGSAWSMHQGAPECEILSFDIDLARLALRLPEPVRYLQQDWSSFDYSGHDIANALAYFDDHVDQVRRLEEAAARGVRLALYDDDLATTAFYVMSATPDPLPKIEFLLDPRLPDGAVLEWRVRGRTQRYTVEGQRFDAIRPVIAATDRLPDTSRITSIHHLPFRIVAIDPARATPPDTNAP